MSTDDVGIYDLARALQDFREEYDLDAVTAARRLPDGAHVKLTAWRNGIVSLERDGRELRLVLPEAE